MLTFKHGLGAVAAAAAGALVSAQGGRLTLPRAAPTVEQIVSLKRVGPPALSPDGRFVAYPVREARWEQNAYETQIWVADTRTGETRQLTSGRGSSSSPAWAPDGLRLAFISTRTDTRQLYVMDTQTGEAERLPTADDGLAAFAWSPDGSRIAYTATDAKPAAHDRARQLGDFEIADEEPRPTRLFVLDIAARAARPLTSASSVVGSFAWSPDGESIAFERRTGADPASFASTDIAVVSIAGGAVRAVVEQPGPDLRPVWSPDGTRIAFQSALGSPNFYYTNAAIAVVPATGGPPQVLTAGFDENPQIVAWKANGIFFTAAHRTWAYLYRLDPGTKSVLRLAPDDEWIGTGFSLSRDGMTVACIAADAKSYPEIYVAPVTLKSPKRLTDVGSQLASMSMPSLDVITWKSPDGTPIEGVLRKPADFEPTRRYPLLVIVHDGPNGVSRPIPYANGIYPTDVWVARGSLVLEPNYRGSAGYGEKFRSLGVRNLGLGDAADVLSGIDAVLLKAAVDQGRIGVMGWSQGGFVAAFLGTHDSSRFKAVSVGAGIADWTTYYATTDLTPFTRQYLLATPWEDPAIYQKTSPITYVKQAKAPTLLQHGDADERVPLANALEFYRALRDQQVPARLITYRGFGGNGHAPTRPGSLRALMDHNIGWFDEYVFKGLVPVATGSSSGSAPAPLSSAAPRSPAGSR